MDAERLNQILEAFPRLSIAVAGDFFLDQYWEIDAGLTEVSLETRLNAYQIVSVRNYAGAAGTVVNNLVALGIGAVYPIGFMGDDGNGFELRRALSQRGVNLDDVLELSDRRTPSYIKPIMIEGRAPREIERMDIKNRTPLPRPVEEEIIGRIERRLETCDGLIVGDQVEEDNCGVITDRVRDCIAGLGEKHPEKVLFADSRRRIGRFRSVIIKPNQSEAARALRLDEKRVTPTQLVGAISTSTGRPACVTFGERGILAYDGREALHVPGFVTSGPTDIVGAGDSLTAGMVAALCAGAGFMEAALLGNLVASITVEQIGVTGTATADQLRARFRQYIERFPEIAAQIKAPAASE